LYAVGLPVSGTDVVLHVRIVTRVNGFMCRDFYRILHYWTYVELRWLSKLWDVKIVRL